jgi:hypothetical protein
MRILHIPLKFFYLVLFISEVKVNPSPPAVDPDMIRDSVLFHPALPQEITSFLIMYESSYKLNSGVYFP